MERIAQYERTTKETSIKIKLNLDGKGEYEIRTGIGFFDHMLCLLAKHSMVDLSVECQGDLEVDSHHTVEDVGIALGTAIAQALGDKKGITRYGSEWVPMDEVLCLSCLDISGRPFLVFHADFVSETIGQMQSDMVEEFFRALAYQAGITLHIDVRYGKNAHHISEAIFKSTARALRAAVSIDPRQSGIPSTKGVL